MNKVIFLDIDGVLNSSEFHSSERGVAKRKETTFPDAHLDEEAIKRINELCDKIGAVIVISSTWREFSDCVPALRRNGLSGWIIGKTPNLDNIRESGLYTAKSRGSEIQAWLDNNKGWWDEYIIIDDDSDILDRQKPYFIQTTALTGFDEIKLYEALHRFKD